MEGLIWQEPSKSLGPKGVLVRCGDIVIGVIVHIPGKEGVIQQFQAWKPYDPTKDGHFVGMNGQFFIGNFSSKLAALESIKAAVSK